MTLYNFTNLEKFLKSIGVQISDSNGGYKLIKLRTGNYDVDYFTKLLGWAMAIFGIIGLFQCYEYLN